MVFKRLHNGAGVLLLAVCFFTGLMLPASAKNFMTPEVQARFGKSSALYNSLRDAYENKQWDTVLRVFKRYKRAAEQVQLVKVKTSAFSVDVEERQKHNRDVANYNALLHKMKKEFAASHGYAALAFAKKKQLTESEKLLDSVQDYADDLGVIPAARGVVAYARTEYKVSEKLLKKAFALDKNLFEPVYYLYKLADKKGEIGTAYFWLEKSVALAPERLDLVMGQAKLLQKLGQSAAAESIYTKLLEIDSTNAVAYNNRGYSRVAMGDVEGAFKDFTSALVINSVYIEALLNRAALWRTTKNLSAALEDLNAGLQVSAGDTRLLISRMQTLQDMGRYLMAKEDMEDVLTRSDSISVINEAGWFLATCPSEAVRDGKRAVKILLPIVEQSKRHPRVLDSLAAAYAETNEFDKAMKIQKEAIERGNDYRLSSYQLQNYEKRLALYTDNRPFRNTME